MELNTLTPFKNRILAKLIPEEELTNGIYLGSSNENKYKRYQTISVGKDIDPSITKDSTLYVVYYAGVNLSPDYVLLKEDEILAIQ